MGLTGLGLAVAFTLIALVVVQMLKPSSPRMNVPMGRVMGMAARLPCMANDSCPVGQKCNGGFCSEGFMSPVLSISNDMSSCAAKECMGINAPCKRSATPCPEGTFCQGDRCVSIAAPDQGEAYDQIGGLL